jgi:hypothetical protein
MPRGILTPPILDTDRAPHSGVQAAVQGAEVTTAMSDHEESGTEPGRRRGRHAAPAAATPAAGSLTALRDGLARTAAAIQPGLTAARGWLSKRRLPVFVVAATVATLALLGGTVAVLQATAPPQPADDAAPAVSTVRPSSSDRETPDTFAPILPSPAPPTPLAPLATTPAPEDADAPPPGDEPVPEPTTEPTDEGTGTGRDTAPGQTKKPEQPGG